MIIVRTNENRLCYEDTKAGRELIEKNTQTHTHVSYMK